MWMSGKGSSLRLRADVSLDLKDMDTHKHTPSLSLSFPS